MNISSCHLSIYERICVLQYINHVRHRFFLFKRYGGGKLELLKIELWEVNSEKHLSSFQELLPRKYYNICLVDQFH